MLKVDNEGELIYTYSNSDFKIRRSDGEIFEEAYDPINSEYSYEETTEKIYDYEEENTEDNTHDEAERLLNILVYGSERGE